jgi:hypothetical protein
MLNLEDGLCQFNGQGLESATELVELLASFFERASVPMHIY